MKKFIYFLGIILISTTVLVGFLKPKMHKPFSFAVIDYLIKFNDDGSMTTVKQTTTTKLQKED